MWYGLTNEDANKRHADLLKNRQNVRLNFILLNGREPNFNEMTIMMTNLNSTYNEKEYTVIKKKRISHKK